MFPPRKLTDEVVFQVTDRAYLTKARPGLSQQFVGVCIRMDDGTLVSFAYLELDKNGVYHDGQKVLGKREDSEFIEYIRKITAHPGDEEEELFASVCAKYTEIKSIKKVAKVLSLSEERVRRILITEKFYTCEQYEKIMALLSEGKTIDEISILIDMKPKQIKTYLPYDRDSD